MDGKSYKDIVEALKKDILSGKYSSCHAFPSVGTLVRKFGVARGTVHHAFDELARQGLISRKQGRGTFVTNTATSRKIGLIVPGVACTDFFQPIVSEINQLARREDYTLLFAEVFSLDREHRIRQVRELAAEFVKKRVADEGTLTSWTQDSSFVLSGKLTLDENAVLTYYAGYANPTPVNDGRNLEIRSTLAGPASSKISIAGAAGKNTMQSSLLQISDAAGFLGTIEAAPDEGLHDFTLAITGPFGGSVGSLPAGTKAVSVNYDGLPAETGLRVATATPDATVRTGIVLYSANRDFAAKKLPLLTFPSSPNVRAKDFTVRHAAAIGGAATAFEKLRFRSNADGSCTLMANSSGGMALILK